MNHCKLQTLCSRYFSSGPSLLAKDLDRCASNLVLSRLASITNTPISRVKLTTLRELEGTIFPQSSVNSPSRFFLPLGVYHRLRTRFGLMCCPECLANDTAPYFRRSWRFSLLGICPIHKTPLHDHCHQCGFSYAIVRTLIGNSFRFNPQSVCLCSKCGADVRLDTTLGWYDASEREKELLIETACNLRLLFDGKLMPLVHDACSMRSFIDVLERLSRTMVSKRHGAGVHVLQKAVYSAAGINAPNTATENLLERFSPAVRMKAVAAAYWLLSDWPSRLERIDQKTPLWSSALIQNIHRIPSWYGEPIYRICYRPLASSQAKRAKAV
ncbi:TniQ protein [Permianibacter aggregans]|uniref:TniQ protein n=1 Tax=Permianibacter aggregans TaxID=1510150 RepID=A0A4R6UZA6_9GAMM|nr:TniQ protein [Permianibacter aggregans]